MQSKKNIVYSMLTLLVIVISSPLAEAQTISRSETLEYLNLKFQGKCSFKDKKKYVLVSFNKGGEVYREDKVYFKDMNHESVSYSKDEKSIIMRCREGAPECVERKIIRLKKLDHYFRISFIIESTDEKVINGVKEAFIHLIKLATFTDYERTEAFE